MTTPTREQVSAWVAQADAYASSQTSDFQEHGEIAAERLCTLAMSAGRAQGLRDAKEVCEREAEGFGGIAAGPFATDFGKHTHNAMAAGAKNCAAAIEQLRGK